MVLQKPSVFGRSQIFEAEEVKRVRKKAKSTSSQPTSFPPLYLTSPPHFHAHFPVMMRRRHPSPPPPPTKRVDVDRRSKLRLSHSPPPHVPVPRSVWLACLILFPSRPEKKKKKLFFRLLTKLWRRRRRLRRRWKKKKPNEKVPLLS